MGLMVLLLLGAGSITSLTGQHLDLNQSLEIAKERYPTIRSKLAVVEANVSEQKVVKSAYIPRVTLQHQYTFSTSNSLEGGFYPSVGTLSPSGGIRTENSYSGVYGSFTSALMEWDVFGFGKLSTKVKAAKADVRVSEKDLENEIFQHQVRVADAYLLLLMAEKLTVVHRANQERAKNFNEAVNAAVKSQMRPEVDGLLARSEYEKAKVLHLQSQQMEWAGRVQLMELLSLDIQSDTLQVDSMHFYSDLPGIESTLSTVLENPLLRLQEARAEAAHYRATAARSDVFPTISLVAAGWARGSGISNVDGSISRDFSTGTQYQVKNYLVGVSARWTITDGFSVMNRYHKFQYIARQNEELYNSQQLQLQRQFREAQNQYQVMLDQAEAVQLQLDAARQAYAQAQARYTSGLTDLPTLLQSMVGLNHAEADKAITYSNVWRSILALTLAKGDLTMFLSAFE